MSILDEVMALLQLARKAKTEKELRALVEQLQDEVERLRATVADFEPRGERCPSCGKLSWFVTASAPDRTFGRLGGVMRTYTCKLCAFTEGKLITPRA